MLIALDIGNSFVKIGFFAGRTLFIREIATHPLLPSSRYMAFIRDFIKENNMDKTPEGIIISSVVQGHTEAFMKALERLFTVRPFMVDYAIKTGIRLDIPNPEGLGADRIANIVAAEALFKCPVAVVDFGTATTISVVGRASNYIGGAILPGLRLMNESLAQGTSRLSEVQIGAPGAALGTDTYSCIRSGLLFGTAGAVERIIGEIERETGLRLKIAITGGHSGLISKYVKRRHTVIPLLTLKGLKTIYTRNIDA
jgi:type III pantothenate kinase